MLRGFSSLRVTLQVTAWQGFGFFSEEPIFDCIEEPFLGSFKIWFPDRVSGSREWKLGVSVDQSGSESLLEKITDDHQGVVAALTPMVAPHRDP
jgi:hypothetical protein